MPKKSDADPSLTKRKLTHPEKLPTSGKKKKKTIQQLQLERSPEEKFVKTEVLMSSEGPFILPPPQPKEIDPRLEQDVQQMCNQDQNQAIQDLSKEIDSMDQTTHTQKIQFVDQSTQTDPVYLPAASEGVPHCSNNTPQYSNQGNGAFDSYPIHGDRLEKKTSPKSFTYLRCPHFDKCYNKACGVITGVDYSFSYLETVSRSLYPELRFLWDKLSCFCSSTVIQKKSASQKNPGRLYLPCRYKQCDYFQWADVALFAKTRDYCF